MAKRHASGVGHAVFVPPLWHDVPDAPWSAVRRAADSHERIGVGDREARALLLVRVDEAIPRPLRAAEDTAPADGPDTQYTRRER